MKGVQKVVKNGIIDVQGPGSALNDPFQIMGQRVVGELEKEVESLALQKRQDEFLEAVLLARAVRIRVQRVECFQGVVQAKVVHKRDGIQSGLNNKTLCIFKSQ